MPLDSGEICANGYQITKAFQLSGKQLHCFADLSRPGDAAKTNGAETLLPFPQEPGARTELTFVHVVDPPLRIYKNEYDQPPVSHYPRHRNCVRIRSQDGGTRVSTREALEIAKKKGWLDERRPHQLGALKVPPSTEENTSLSKDDQPSKDKEVM